MNSLELYKDDYKEKDGVCERCGTTENVDYVIDPYDEEICNIERWCYLCPKCYEVYCDEI